MDDMRLQNPIAIAVGAGFRRDITTLAEMQNFLQEWPHARRGKILRNGAEGLRMARAGHVTKDQALQLSQPLPKRPALPGPALIR